MPSSRIAPAPGDAGAAEPTEAEQREQAAAEAAAEEELLGAARFASEAARCGGIVLLHCGHADEEARVAGVTLRRWPTRSAAPSWGSCS